MQMDSLTEAVNALSSDDHTQGYQSVSIVRHINHTLEVGYDEVVEESPVALIYNGISHAVMMATPLDLEVFAIGFSLTEAIIDHPRQIYDIEIIRNDLGVQVEITIASEAFIKLKMHKRTLAGQTGCGICGVESLEQIKHNFSPVTHEFSCYWLDQIPDALAQLQQQQFISSITGGAHAAAWVVNGKILNVFEDVGRHNALDKLLGYLVKNKVDRSQGFVLMTSRASYELVKKCVQLNISLLATISAPTSLAVELAKRSGLKLVSFCRQSRYVVYS